MQEKKLTKIRLKTVEQDSCIREISIQIYLYLLYKSRYAIYISIPNRYNSYLIINFLTKLNIVIIIFLKNDSLNKKT